MLSDTWGYPLPQRWQYPRLRLRVLSRTGRSIKTVAIRDARPWPSEQETVAQRQDTLDLFCKVARPRRSRRLWIDCTAYPATRGS